MKSSLMIPCLLLLGWTSQSEGQIDPVLEKIGEKEVSWVLGRPGEGDCRYICLELNEVTFDGWGCDESAGRQAASDPNPVQYAGIDCKGRKWNQYSLAKIPWSYGFAQCTDPACFWFTPQYSCSDSRLKWPGCKLKDGFMDAYTDGFGADHYSRICPCTKRCSRPGGTTDIPCY
eukprot:TRINITY_DN7937_c0_g1_i1.p1 TRINITY_DN7937_c0_g1~~TRINITY_DN7937_c0_g1_i1.p1  ORF type:complete len:174 (-),score=3.31 TRINITY_DN7937_c0_g1_i1:167-688(-)